MAKLYCDTREIGNDYILRDFDALGVDYEIRKCDEGDYESSANPLVAIDLKFGIAEVQANIACARKKRGRFIREMERCVEKGKTLYVLIREPKIYNVYGVKFWKSPKRADGTPYTKVNANYIMAIMRGMSEKYGVKWVFCKPENAAISILRILNKNGGKIYYNYKKADEMFGKR